MTLFWILAAALTALALLLVLPSILRRRSQSQGTVDGNRANLAILRDQLKELDAELASGRISTDQHAAAKAEIQRRVLDERGLSAELIAPAGAAVAATSKRSAVFLAVCIPLFVFGMYGFIGNPQALSPQMQAPNPEGEVTQAQVEAMVAQLAQRLENAPANEPADPKGWEMLARTYAAMQRFPEADKAYVRATALAPNNAQLLADHADVMAMLQGQSAMGSPETLIERALKLDPKNLKALALAGSAAFERKDFARAARYWSEARQLAPPGSEFASGLDRSLEVAKAAGGAGSTVLPHNAPVSSANSSAATSGIVAAAGGSEITGVVSLSAALAGKIAPDDTVFIFARAAEGPRMPLAILRRKASELPISFTLDDSTAMSPEMKLSKFAQVVVGARISKSGNAMPQPGDLVGQAGPLKPPVDKLDVLINSVQP